MKSKGVLYSAILVVFYFVILPGIGYTLPSEEEVVSGSGSATFDRSLANTLNINQSTDKVIINYGNLEGGGGFSIASGETVNFSQPNSASIALNRVISGNPSEIIGALNANGRIFLVNPSGILFGAGSQVDTAGLIASTLNIKNDDFLAGNYKFYNSVGEGAPGTLVNSGILSAPGGFVALLGVNVENTNTGVISDVKSVALASGNKLTVSLDADSIINVVVTEQADVNPGSKSAGVINAGQIKAGSKVLLTAGVMNGIFDNAINNSGIIEARDIVISGNGNIELSGASPDKGVKASAASGTASVRVESTEGNINIANTEVSARIYDDEEGGNGRARVEILAGADDSTITVNDSVVSAKVDSEGDATVRLRAGKYNWYENYGDYYSFSESLYGGAISISDGSEFLADVGGYGEAYVKLEAGGVLSEYSYPSSIVINDSSIGAYAGRGWAGIDILDGNSSKSIDDGYSYRDESERYYGGHVDLNRSFIKALIRNGSGYKNGAEVFIRAGAININDTDVSAEVVGFGNAEVDIDGIYSYYRNSGWDGDYNFFYENVEDGTVDIVGGSAILATTNGGDASVYVETGPESDGERETYLNIAGSSVVADVNGKGHAEVNLGSDYSQLDLGILESIIGVGDLTGLLDLSSEGDLGGPIYGPITITGSTIHAESEGPIEYSESVGTAVVAMATADDLTISDSTVSANDLQLAAVALYSEGDININAGSTLSATTTEGLAAVVGLAYGSLMSEGNIVADGGEGFGVAALLAECDILAANVSAKGNDNVIPLLENLLEDYLLGGYEGAVSLKVGSKYAYGSGILLGSGSGDIGLGNLSADAVAAVALGQDDYGSIYDLGDVNARLLILVARNNIGTAESPIRVNTDILSAYSMDYGDIYIDSFNPGNTELGLYIPLYFTDSEGTPYSKFYGQSIAAYNGIVHIVSEGDLTVNSILAPFGGVFLQSTNGSLYAGNGWNSVSDGEYSSPEFLGSFPVMDVYDTDWYYNFGITEFLPAVFDYPNPYVNFNLISGGYSYLSSLKGTIGVGSPEAKDPLMSGGIRGVVRPGVVAVTGVNPSSDFDPINGYPSGIVQYYDTDLSEGPQQIWPETLAVGALSFDNPLQVYVEVFEGSAPAVRAGFVPQASLTLQFGVPVPPLPVPPEGDGAFQAAGALNPTLRNYYEILHNYRVVSFEPATPNTFFGYHPLTPTDMSAFDGITLDSGAYDFIADSIKLKKNLAPYFGQ